MPGTETHSDTTDDIADRVLRILVGFLPPDTEPDLDLDLHRFGMDSLTTTRLWFLLRQEFGVDVPMSWLGRCDSPRRLAGYLTAAVDRTEPKPARAAELAGRHDPFPLTDLQQAYQVGKNPHLTDDPVGCHVYREFDVAEVDIPRLCAAWRQVVARHDMLRVALTDDGRQRVLDHPPDAPITVHDLAGGTDDDFADHIEATRARLAQHIYPPDAILMWTVEVSVGPGGRARVHLSIDAMLTDGHGLSVLLDDWWRWYRQPGRQEPLPPLGVRECLALLDGERRSPGYAADLGYWARRLADLPDGPDLGAAQAGGPVRAPGGGLRRTALRAELSAQQWTVVGDLARAWHVSPTAVVLTLFAESCAAHGSRRPFSLVLTTNHRTRLPSEAEGVIGPFTSSMVLPMADTLALPLPAAVRRVHERLWEGLGHSSVSGVTALRTLRARDRTEPPPKLPVVFTSLLSTGRPPATARADFAGSLGYAVSQTSDVALEHQMWERDDALHIRWDVVEEAFPVGVARTVFARFVNALHELTTAPPGIRAMNELQQAYFVPRVTSDVAAAPWGGCQVYHSFEVDDLDLARLESAWLWLVAAHDVLRTVVSYDGELLVSPVAPERRQIPVIRLGADAAGALARLRDTMAGRAVPVGRGPQSDLRVTIDEHGTAIVHLTTDLTIIDGRSIHFLVRELFRRYADPNAEPCPGAPHQEYLAERAALRSDPRYPSWTAHWRDRVAALSSGALPAGPRRPTHELARVRRADRMTGWRAVRSAAESAGLNPDDMLVAAFTQVLAGHFGVPFSIPVVRWTAASARFRPGEYTALSWVSRQDAALGTWAQAEAFHQVLDADRAADAVHGLGELRTKVLRERRTGHFDLPVVFTGLLELSEQPLPAGVRLGPWLTCTPDVSLDCVAIEEGDELRFYWDAVEEHFEPGLLARLFAEYGRLLRALPAQDVTLALSAEQRDTILYGWNDTDVPLPDDGPVHLLFEQQVRLRPAATALRWAGGTLSYAELNTRANRVAWALRDLGVGPGVGVGISVPRGPNLAVAVFGVLKAGGFYVPLEPSLPDERAASIVADADISLLLVTADRRGWPVPARLRSVPVDGRPAGAERDRGDPACVGGPTDLAYVIFTSGSTGRPKGVAVAHRSLRNLFTWCYRTHGFGPGDVGLCVTSLGFDLSVFDLLGLLGCGAGLYIADDAEQHDPKLLLDVLLREPVTFWNSAPTTLHQLAPLLGRKAGARGTERLRLVYLSGDYTPLSLPDDVRGLFGSARIVSLGGATEATVWSNWFEIGAIDPSWRSIPYGRPIDNARYYILDDELQPCPVGVEGDLFIGGECLSVGYYRRPELNEHSFVLDPFDRRPDRRLYRTGDRASYFPDGVISFLGRTDGQVKIRGHRVELDEIEHRLRQHHDVKDVVVLARQDGSGDCRLVAYVIAADGCRPAVSELRRHAAAALPDYMVPNVVALVDAFPSTANGKLDRDALRWPADLGSSIVLSARAKPADRPPAMVDEVAAIFAELLGLGAVDPDADVWDLGATSFTMVQVSAALRDRYDRRVPVATLLAEPTVTGIARVLFSDHSGSDAGTPEPPAVAGVAAGPESVDFFSPADRAAFKRTRWDLRPRADGETTVRLADIPVAPQHFAWRTSHREFAQRPVAAADFARFLAMLREVETGGRQRRTYPSAADTYAVQVYLHVRGGRVEGIDEGLYYYHPVEHALRLVNVAPRLNRSVHFVYNRPVFDQAAFDVYLFGYAEAIEPLYGEDSDRLMLLEAGYLGQVLMLGQVSCGIGVCPIGMIALDGVAAQFGLTDRHRYLHAFLAGPVDGVRESANGAWAPFADGGVADGSAERAVDVAITGVACRFPGAESVDEFWQALRTGTSALGPVPPRRQDRLVTLGHGGFLVDVEGFDSLLFHVSPNEARALDPQLRLLLHTVWECLETAGHTPESLSRTAGTVGVFLGAMWHDHQHVGVERWRSGEPATVSATASEAANRISHFFDFAGPSVAVDTSCSSSLATLHLAVRSIRSGECGAAIVAAANLLTHPYHAALLTGLGLVATELPEGAFDGAVPGWSPGEGVAAVLLRPRVATMGDGDGVLAVIEATRIGHLGGRGRFGTPDVAALGCSIDAMLTDTGLEPGLIGYVECAAAGAALADTAELDALAHVFAGRRTPMPVGTVKPNIGHLEAAAGLSQLVKVLLQLQHRQIAPTLLSDTPHAMVNWQNTALCPADRLVDWQPPAPGEPLRALVNAVGATGSYGHVLLHSVPADVPPAEAVPAAGSQVVLLSAESEAQLAGMAAKLGDRLGDRSAAGEAPRLADVAFTTQTGRVPLRHRLAITCADIGELRAALAAYSRGASVPGLATGIAEPGHEAPVDARSAVDAVPGWLAGSPVPWWRFWTAGQARRVPLPTYPFAVDQCAESPAPKPATLETEEYLKNLYAEVSGIPVHRLHARVPLENYGLSSMLIATLNARLAERFGDGISRTLFFEHRDLAGVTGALDSVPAPYEDTRPDQPDPSDMSDLDGAVAVLGLAGRYPQAPNLDQFWRNLREGVDCITALPSERHRPGWPVDEMVGGFLDDVDRFDPLFFGITPREAALIDPQERLFLEVAWHALEDACYPRARLRDQHNGRVGVFVGSMYNEYPFFGLAEADANGRWTAAGSAIAGIANRLSYFLDLHGPSMTVDTMCSSSLTALHLAIASLRRGECEVAIVGGVNLSLHANKFMQLRDLRMVSSDHRCRSFGAGGDGFVPGEGVGAVLLKPLASAIADGDRIQAVIRGSAVNHGGKTNGYTVPNPVAHGELIVEALRDAGVAADTIGYVEAHGTGTALGDPVEIAGLVRAFAAAGLPAGGCAIGSVKSNIGHLEAAAGIAGLTKVILQFAHRTLAPSLHAEQLNPNIDWPWSPFRVQRVAAPLPATGGAPHRAGVSSFGAGGGNAHVIVESYQTAEEPVAQAEQQLVVLSARTVDQLRDVSRLLVEFIETRGSAAPPLANLAHTLRVGREPMQERLAVLVTDHTQLRERLARFAAGDDAAVVRGTPPTSPVASDLLASIEPAELGRHWVLGGVVDWSVLAGRGRRMVGLPDYPFARMRCWIPERTAVPDTVDTPLLVREWLATERVPATVPTGPIICLFRPDQRALVDALAAELRPAPLLPVREDDTAAGPDGQFYWDDRSAVTVAEELLDRHGPVTGWLDLCALPGEGRSDDRRWSARLAVLQRVLARRPVAGLRAMQVTSGLLDAPGPRPDLAGARLAGFVRSLGAEYPWARADVIDVDLPADWVAELVGQLGGAWRAVGPEGEVCLRGGVRLAPTLVPAPSAPASGWRPDPERVYLVTGGTRGLGALTAAHLVRRGVRKLAILGIRPLPPRHEWTRDDLAEPAATTVAHLRELERGGARVMVHTGALTDRAELGSFLAGVRSSLGAIGGVVHCAGRSTAGPPSLAHKELVGVLRVFEAKADGLDAVLELTGSDPLEFVLLFSSASAAVPALSVGVADYAAANAYLDYVAGYQVRSGRAGFRAIDWPVWRETGGGVDRPDACAAVGLNSLTDAAGLAVLDQVLALQGAASVLPCPALSGQLDTAGLLRANRLPVSAAPSGPTEPGAGPAGWLVRLFAKTLCIPEPELDHGAALGDLGVESVLLAELLEKIERHIGRPLDPTTLLTHPTINLLDAHLAELGTEGTPPAAPVDPGGQTSDEAVAVIGMACRFPGASDIASFWSLLRDGGCAVREVPAGRWDVARHYDPGGGPGRSVSKWGGFVDGIEEFDPDFFGISDDEARNLDPAVRMMLEATASCLADAGYAPAELRGREVGVFVGARMSDYRRRIGLASAAVGLGGDQNFIAARIAHQYDFRGPNLVVDSACSSALVAVQLACRGLLAGDAEIALVGGVEVLLDERPYLEFSAAKALSARGRCATFAEDADGFVPGEGCGLLLLKPLGHALRDGDRVHAVINAVAVGNDGHTMGLTTPNPAAQRQVVRRALDRAGLRAGHIGMLEAHGTATMIGDPIELRALTEMFREHTDRAGYCAIGSVKSNIGHLLSAAGIAGLIKVLLALEYAEIPPTLGCEQPNPRFDFAASPFFLVTRPRPWPDGPRVAGVSAFGLGGTNAHLVATAPVVAPDVRRAPLPPPVFRRRRLWWDRPGAAVPVHEPKGHHPDQRPELVASMLELSFAEGAR